MTAVITSDGGGLLLREVDHRLGLLTRLATCCADYRNPNSIEHDVHALVAQRVLGLAVGITSIVPAMDVTAPRTLSAPALAEAVSAIDATLVFASPAARTNIVATAGAFAPSARAVLEGVRILMSARAPVHAHVLRDARLLMPHAEVHTSYGMTEVQPVVDIDLGGIEATGDGNGLRVGHPVADVAARVSPLKRCRWAGATRLIDRGISVAVLQCPSMRDSGAWLRGVRPVPDPFPARLRAAGICTAARAGSVSAATSRSKVLRRASRAARRPAASRHRKPVGFRPWEHRVWRASAWARARGA